MDPEALLGGLIRGLGLLGLATAVGSLAVERLLPSSPPDDLPPVRARLGRLASGSCAVLALAALADLVARTHAMSRAPLGAAVAAIPDVVAGTHVGAVLAVRAVSLILAALLSLARAGLARVLTALLLAFAALGTSLIGHAADWGDLTGWVAVDWTHVVTASAWTGGLVALSLAVFRSRSAWPWSSLQTVACRFSALAGACLLLTVATGGVNASAQLGALSRLWTTAYGWMLIVKLALVAALAWFGALNRYLNLPRLGPSAAPPAFGARLFRRARLLVLGPRPRLDVATARARLAGYVRREAVVAIGVLACTAALGQITPGRHASFDRRPTSHVTPVQPARPGASSSRVGTVTPPAGDALHGRRVFAELRCFTCHAIRGAGFPEPSRPGPDLTSIGTRHPGYLIESIINPNALIVDGPGYTDARGLSTMPEYRGQLKVGDLIDLVAYLATLHSPPDSPPTGNRSR